MSFLNAILLAGAAAFTIPLLIHLLTRRRTNTVRWGAMHLLEQALRLRKRNLHVEQKLLLATRIAIPVFLALCLARPVFSLLRQLPGLNKTSLVVLLDDSASMLAPGGSGTGRDRALTALRRIFDRLPRGSDVSVILAGSPPRLLPGGPTASLDLILETLNAQPSLAGPLNLSESLQLATTQLKRSQTAARELLILSDFQHSDWQPLLDGAALPELDAIKAIEPAPPLTLFHLPTSLQENLTLTHVDTSAFIVARDQSLALRATLKNHGQRDYQDIPVQLEVDGAPIRSTRVSIPPKAETRFTLTHTFNQPGDHAITLRVEGDAFTPDNAFSLVIPVRNQLDVLLITGRPGTTVMTGPADFLELALRPHQSAAATLKDLIHTTTIHQQRFREADLAGKSVVLMANVEKLSGNQLEDLKKFIRSGGSLIVFTGPDCDPKWYEHEFFHDADGPLPARPAGFAHVDDGQPPARILSQRHTHPATAYFNDARGLSLQDAAFTHWQRFDRLENDARPLLSLDRGDPFLIEKPYGKGRVLLFASTANAQWNTLPLQPAFVPLMQRLITHLATASAAPPFQRTGDHLQFTLSAEEAGVPLQLVDPLHQFHQLAPRIEQDKTAFIDHPDTLLPGIYEIRPAQPAGAPATHRFAFNPDPGESDLATLSSDQARQIAKRLGAGYADDGDSFQRLNQTRRHGSEIWQPLLLILLFFLFAEVFLQQRIARA